MKKKLLFLPIFALLLAAFCLPVFAVEGQSSPSLSDIEDVIPPEIKDALPSPDDPDAIGSLDAAFFVKQTLGSLGGALKSGGKILALLMAVILITALFDALRNSSVGQKEGLSHAFDLASSAAALTCLYGVVWSQFEAVKSLISSMGTFMNTVVPITGAILLSSGGVTSGTVASANLLLASAAAETVASRVLFPVLSICFAFTVAAHIAKTPALSQVSDMIRNGFCWILGFLSALIVTVFAFQSKVAASADSVAMRSAKFAAGSFLPVVGGTVSETMRTVMGGFSLIKNTAGAFCIAAILTLVLPTLVTLFVTRLVLWLSGIAARLAGTSRLADLFSDTGRIVNFTIAVSLIFGIVGIFEFAIFMGIAIT